MTLALLPCGAALAATATSDFEAPTFQLGSVNGQQGWRAGGNQDQAVVPSGGVPTFGQQSWRLSNLFVNSAFTGTQTYSTPVVPPAGENLPNTVFIAKFSFFDPKAQPNLFVSVSPDSGEGSRMAWVGLTDTGNGVLVTTSDSSGPGGDFVDTDLATLSYGAPHTIEWRIKLNPGEDNDQVRILIDGQDVGQCFTTWENYYRASSEQAGAPNFNKPPDINSLQFRTSVPGFDIPNAGYLFDNVSVTTGTGPTSPGCDVTIDKQPDSPTVTAGALEGYRLTVHNRGHLTARNYLLCDHIPRNTTFVSADRKLRRLGRRRCLLIPRLAAGQSTSVHLMLRVNATAPQGILDNIADVGPVEPPALPVVPPATLVPDLPSGQPVTPATAIKAIVVKKVRALVRVVRAAQAVRPPPPTVTG